MAVDARHDSPPKQVVWVEERTIIQGPLGVVQESAGGFLQGAGKSLQQRPNSSLPINHAVAKDMLSHIARVDARGKTGTSSTISAGRSRDISPGAAVAARPLSANVLAVTHTGTMSISETNNPLVDRLINELRRLLTFQQKETREARKQNVEMNKLLFERNEFVKVTIASLKREEYNSTMLIDEVRRMKRQVAQFQQQGTRPKKKSYPRAEPDEVDGPERGEPSLLLEDQEDIEVVPDRGLEELEVDEFEHLRREIVRLHQDATKAELLLRVKDEQNAVLQERIDALEASGLTLVNRKFGGRNATFMGPKSGEDHEEWLRRQAQEENERSLSDGHGDQRERLTLLAIKLKSLVRELNVDGAAADSEGDPELLEPESYAAQLAVLLVGEEVGPDGSPVAGKLHLGGGPDPAMVALLENKDAEIAQMRLDYASRLASYEADTTDQQIERAQAEIMREEVMALRNEVAILSTEDERKAGEIEQLYQDVLSMDRDLQDSKRDIEAIEENMRALSAQLEGEMLKAEGLHASVDEQTALLGDANAHIARLNEILQFERVEANAAAAQAASTIAQDLATILETKTFITALEQQAIQSDQANARAMATKVSEAEKLVAFYTGEVATRDTRITDLLEQIDEWEKKMSLFDIIKGYEVENIELRASLADYMEQYRMRRERLGMLAEDGLFLSLLLIERGKFVVKCANLDDAMAAIKELMHKNVKLYRAMAKERIDFADTKETLARDYAAHLAAFTSSNEARLRTQVAERTADVAVLKGLLSMLEKDAQHEAYLAKDAIRVREEKIESLQQTIEELDRILFDKDVLLLRLRSENAAFRAGELDKRVRTKVAARALKLVLAEDPSNEVRAPRQRLKLVEEALVKAEARATMWEHLAAGYELGIQSTHAEAFDMDANMVGGLEYAYGSIFNASVKERIFSLRAAAVVSSRAISTFSLDALHAWAEAHDMTERDEDKALRSVQLSWPALESMVDIQVFCDMINAEQATSNVRLDEMQRIDRREEEMRRRLFVLFASGRVSLPEMRAVRDLRMQLDLSTKQVEEVLESMQVSGLRLTALAERAAHSLLDEYEVRSAAVLRRDFDAIMTELDGPGKTFRSAQFLVHCRTLHQEVHAAARLRQKYAELKLAFNTTKLQTAIAESKVHSSIRKRHIHPADGLPMDACRACLHDAFHDAHDEATDKMERRMTVCRDALQKELARLVARGGLSVGRGEAARATAGSMGQHTMGHLQTNLTSQPLSSSRRATPSDAATSLHSEQKIIIKDGVLLRIDENLESIELQLAQFGGEWDKTRLVFVKLLRSKLQDELHLRAEQRRLGARLREAEQEASEVLALAEEASVAWGREDDGAAMVSRLIYETQQQLVSSNERIRSALVLVSSLRLKEVKALQQNIFDLEDHVEALQSPERLDTSAYPPVTFAPNSFTGEEEGLSLSVLQGELSEIRTLDLSLDRLENIAEVVENLLLNQTHRDAATLDGILETLIRLDVLDVQALPDHHMMKVCVNWAPHSFPVLSAVADAQEQQERDSFIESVHLSQQLDRGQSVATLGSLGSEGLVIGMGIEDGGDMDSQSEGDGGLIESSGGGDLRSVHTMHSHHSSLSLKPGPSFGSMRSLPDRGSSPGVKKPRSSKVVPTELEVDYAKTTSALAQSMSVLKDEMINIHAKVERSLEDHQESMNVAEASILTARIATTSATTTAEAARTASKAAADAQALALAMQEANAKKTCSLM